jgi:hypothetical protein
MIAKRVRAGRAETGMLAQVQRRAMAVTDVLVTDLQIARWRYTGSGMRPVVLASVAAT